MPRSAAGTAPGFHRSGIVTMRLRIGVTASIRASLIATACTSLLACSGSGAITWDVERRVSGVMAGGATLVLADGGVPAVRAAWTPVRWPDDSAACAGSQVAVISPGDAAVAAWWHFDATGLRLLAARSADGGLTWGPSIVIAADDPRPGGCTRPPPGIGLDAATGAAHFAFHGRIGGTAGLAVSVIRRGSPTAAPSTLVATGGTPRPAAVAASRDTVAVAFESPSTPDDAVWLAISLGSGHIPRVVGRVSSAGARAYDPTITVRNGQVGVAWNEHRDRAGGPAAVARVGRFNR